MVVCRWACAWGFSGSSAGTGGKWGRCFGETEKTVTFAPGEVAEWSIAAVLKTVELRGSGGSNPSLSANKKRDLSDLTLDFTQ